MAEDEQAQGSEKEPTSESSGRYAYLRNDGTLDIVVGSLVAGIGAYAYQFIGGRSLGEEGFAPIGVLLTAHFLAFVIVLLPIEQFVIRRNGHCISKDTYSINRLIQYLGEDRIPKKLRGV